MKILVIMDSPRKGESYSVVKNVEAQMQALGDVEFDYVWLRDVKFKQCTGCHACIRFGETKCPFRDETASILDRMAAADGLILVTPVYSQQVSYLMKIFIDRLSFLWHRPRFFGKFIMGISAGGAMAKPVLSYLKETTTRWGYTYVSEIGAQHPDALVPKMRAKLEKDIQKATRRFYQAIQDGRVPAPSFADVIWFRMWRMTAIASREFTPADYQHWTETGWFKQDYYTGKPVGAVKRLFGLGMEKIMQTFMRKVYVGY